MSHDEMIAVIQAHKEGKEIEWQPSKDSVFNKWQECDVPIWDFKTCKYRVKPEPPKPREWWVTICPEIKDGIRINEKKSNMYVCCKEQILVREVMPEHK